MRIIRTAFHAASSAAMTAVVFGTPVLVGLLVGFAPRSEVVTVEGGSERVAEVVWALAELDPEPPAPPAHEPEPEPASAPEPEPQVAELGTPEPRRAAPERRPRVQPKPVRPTRTAKKRGGRKRDCGEDNPLIDRTSAGVFTVERDLVEYYVTHLRALDSLGWVKANKEKGGKSDGLRVGGVKCGSDLHQAGIRSGDVIHTANGLKLKNLTQAVFVYTRLRKKSSVELAITRDGKLRKVRYRIT